VYFAFHGVLSGPMLTSANGDLRSPAAPQASRPLFRHQKSFPNHSSEFDLALWLAQTSLGRVAVSDLSGWARAAFE
jgi:hypothetical protein